MRRRFVVLSVAVAVLLGLGVASLIFPGHVRLLRPSALRQLDPRMVELVNEFPAVDQQNEEIIGRLFAHGGLGHAEDGPDGVMRIDIRVPSGQLIWNPAIVVMPRAGAGGYQEHADPDADGDVAPAMCHQRDPSHGRGWSGRSRRPSSGTSPFTRISPPPVTFVDSCRSTSMRAGPRSDEPGVHLSAACSVQRCR